MEKSSGVAEDIDATPARGRPFERCRTSRNYASWIDPVCEEKRWLLRINLFIVKLVYGMDKLNFVARYFYSTVNKPIGKIKK